MPVVHATGIFFHLSNQVLFLCRVFGIIPRLGETLAVETDFVYKGIVGDMRSYGGDESEEKTYFVMHGYFYCCFGNDHWCVDLAGYGFC